MRHDYYLIDCHGRFFYMSLSWLACCQSLKLFHCYPWVCVDVYYLVVELSYANKSIKKTISLAMI